MPRWSALLLMFVVVAPGCGRFAEIRYARALAIYSAEVAEWERLVRCREENEKSTTTCVGFLRNPSDPEEEKIAAGFDEAEKLPPAEKAKQLQKIRRAVLAHQIELQEVRVARAQRLRDAREKRLSNS